MIIFFTLINVCLGVVLLWQVTFEVVNVRTVRPFLGIYALAIAYMYMGAIHFYNLIISDWNILFSALVVFMLLHMTISIVQSLPYDDDRANENDL